MARLNLSIVKTGIDVEVCTEKQPPENLLLNISIGRMT